MTLRDARGRIPQRGRARGRAAPLQLVWLIPIVALLVGGWLALKALRETAGPTITIQFKTARGHRGRQDPHQLQGGGHRHGAAR